MQTAVLVGDGSTEQKPGAVTCCLPRGLHTAFMRLSGFVVLCLLREGQDKLGPSHSEACSEGFHLFYMDGSAARESRPLKMVHS